MQAASFIEIIAAQSLMLSKNISHPARAACGLNIILDGERLINLSPTNLASIGKVPSSLSRHPAKAAAWFDQKNSFNQNQVESQRDGLLGAEHDFS